LWARLLTIPAIAVVPPVAALPRPAHWVAARPDHGAASPRARAGLPPAKIALLRPLSGKPDIEADIAE